VLLAGHDHICDDEVRLCMTTRLNLERSGTEAGSSLAALTVNTLAAHIVCSLYLYVKKLYHNKLCTAPMQKFVF
jgi:hypothetical protein